ncbi:helix-turn-helix domain-containing protein [Streptomyces sp. NPDC052727]|uniref:helix-turn-helix domain-containing protein n=1 Tax=Streptomyces sp. NPDC052727 TaxID=3154854 RepID=UPI0034221575
MRCPSCLVSGLYAPAPGGRVGGRRPKLTEDQAALAQRLYGEREKTVQQIADMFGVPRSTVYGHLDKTRTVPRQPKKTAVTKP